jgi:AmmeMemoRadiSam system protein B
MNREMNFAGSFYPNSCESIKDYISAFNSVKIKTAQPKFVPKAIISPHAGYVYSGFTANMVYKVISKYNFKRVVVIGPSHHHYSKKASVGLYDKYNTPCGDLDIDLEYSKKLIEKYDILTFIKEMHKEHSTETQIPFIKHYLPDAKVVEIVYGDIDYKSLVPILKEIIDEPDTLIVISTDLSHFHTLEVANQIDNICIKGIKELNISTLEKGCEACGIIGVKAIVSVTNESLIADYRTSYDASGDSQRVVGYLSVFLR